MESMVRILGAFVDTLVLNIYPTDHDFEIEERRVDESLNLNLAQRRGSGEESDATAELRER